MSNSLKNMLISLESTNPELKSIIRPLLEVVKERDVEDDVQDIIDWVKDARLRAAAIQDKDARLDAYSGIITDMIVKLNQSLAKDVPTSSSLREGSVCKLNTRLARLSDEYPKT